jgi:MinD superfamily P-loop ATPase
VRQLVVLSGKGGTGKTSITAALAHLAAHEGSIVAADADVDAANLELVLQPTPVEEHAFISGSLAVVDAELCTACGRCAEVCRFGAVIAGNKSYRIEPVACEGCASCYYQCPVQAIRLEPRHSGQWYRSETPYGPLFHAHLFAGQENSGKLVTLVKQQARLWALDHKACCLLVDGPPGIGCPVISASAGADLALLVVEPTVSGVHDLERIHATTEHFGVQSVVLVNKADLNPRRAEEITSFCAAHSVPIAGYVPFDVVVTEAMVQGQPVTAYADGPVSRALKRVWQRLRGQLTS